jgi:hypothetical protein
MMILLKHKTMSKASLFILTVFILASCTKEEKPIGIWDDIIQLSTKSAEFSANKDSVIITTGGDWWWINDISFEDSIYSYYNRKDVNMQSESYSINEEYFRIERRNKNTLFIEIDKNDTGKERLMSITLEAGDYFDYVKVKQKAN